MGSIVYVATLTGGWRKPGIKPERNMQNFMRQMPKGIRRETSPEM